MRIVDTVTGSTVDSAPQETSPNLLKLAANQHPSAGPSSRFFFGRFLTCGRKQDGADDKAKVIIAANLKFTRPATELPTFNRSGFLCGEIRVLGIPSIHVLPHPFGD